MRGVIKYKQAIFSIFCELSDTKRFIGYSYERLDLLKNVSRDKDNFSSIALIYIISACSCL